MQTKHLCVLIHIWTKVKVGVPWNRFKPSSKIFFVTVPRGCFFCGSFMLFLSCFCYAFVRICLLMPCGHLLGKGWPLGSRLWCLIVKLSLSHWYPGSGVVLDCIDSWSLPSFLLSREIKHLNWCEYKSHQHKNLLRSGFFNNNFYDKDPAGQCAWASCSNLSTSCRNPHDHVKH